MLRELVAVPVVGVKRCGFFDVLLDDTQYETYVASPPWAMTIHGYNIIVMDMTDIYRYHIPTWGRHTHLIDNLLFIPLA